MQLRTKDLEERAGMLEKRKKVQQLVRGFHHSVAFYDIYLHGIFLVSGLLHMHRHVLTAAWVARVSIPICILGSMVKHAKLCMS